MDNLLVNRSLMALRNDGVGENANDRGPSFRLGLRDPDTRDGKLQPCRDSFFVSWL